MFKISFSNLDSELELLNFFASFVAQKCYNTDI